jgi:broad specificity phosphatase PhoE
MSTLFLIRHGEITQSKPRRFVGQRELPLTDRGREQASRLGKYLAAQSITKVVCSPLSRCVESARIICRYLGGVPQVLPDLREIALGAWEGLTVEEVRSRFPGCHEARGMNLAGFRPQAGESFVDLLGRVWPAFEAVVHDQEESVAVVAHSGVNRVLLCRILDIPLGNLFRLDQDFGCLSVIQYNENGYRVKSINFYPGETYCT